MSDPLRLQWIKSLRQFRTGVRTLHRIGGLEQVCDEARDMVDQWTGGDLPRMLTAPDWSDPYWVTLLSTCIYEGRYTQELLRGFALSVSFIRRPVSSKVVAAIEEVLKSRRALLKESFYNIHYSEVKSNE